MPTNDERRQVAARLRELIKQYGMPNGERFYELLDRTLDDPSGYHSYVSVTLYLADLIEPEPERTCQVIARHDGPNVYEHELSCGHSCEWVWDGPPAFCPACGSKVIE